MNATRPCRIVVTGGAGFVGSNLALLFKRDRPEAEVVAFDNLRRRGSELALDRLRAGGVRFAHGDVRNPEDLEELGAFDLLLECSAEPSVHAGYDGSPAYVINTNLVGTVNCLEAARRHGADMVFLSTSRVYPIDPLRRLPLERGATRLVLPGGAAGPGWSAAGIATGFPMPGSRSIYGATKLASELMIEEYGAMYGLRAVINRCGVLTGPWQMGKVDQGVVVLWAARHLYGGTLSYSGFGGEGLQVRDMLHVADLYDLLRVQVAGMDRFKGRIFNVGGGPEVSVSLAELTRLCAERTGRTIPIAASPETRAADIPWYVTDNADVTQATGWRPQRTPGAIMDELIDWLGANRRILEPILL
ncbi:NAD-dependent epimerase/dehydratase family protein (plasmid) [Azospirillum brasilense]|uniref:NAD-dependent epimerase/dehydratase family protein n=1 Tax=Azospirillum brasilense TaxID=192 RepID=A0A4D8RFT3_AZOBR|nr:NAD-dependent epimerase/dehydratase family protein [Azospirillum brasilense]QCO19994.1 NAD-dependent epimerase/dehydratase family protein [Azospirillum brasilense]